MENKFKVGDIIKGKEESCGPYTITTEDMTMAEVISTECCVEGRMKIKILSHKTRRREVGGEYEVENSTEYFDYYNFTRDNLEFADVITLRNGERYVYVDGYIQGEDADYDADCDTVKEDYKDNLTRNSETFNYSGKSEDYDIVKVERVGEVVYQRGNTKEPVEMTVAEISEKLGYEVKIVKEN